MKKLLFIASSLIVVAVTLSVAINAQMSLFGGSQLQKLNIAELAISKYYVDSVDEQKMVESAITGMLKELDPHSSYTTAEETKELTEPLEGKFSGIGVQFNLLEDTVYVIQTIVGGPSEKVGILAGDRIIAANDTAIAGVKMKQKEIMKRLRGKKGSKVMLKVKRAGEKEPLDFLVTRDDIPLYSIDTYYMLNSEVGYVYVSRFAESTHEEFTKAVDDLRSQGMKRLIIDLQDNGGGYLSSATKIANEFLDKGQLIVYTEGKASPKYEEKASGGGKYKDIDVVVIVNQYSASASEILSGALQDWDRAVIVGRRSFGKGLVQRPFPFSDGSMIRLTIARYYTPSGRCIQKPYQKGHVEDYEKDILNRFEHGEFTNADSIQFNDSLRYTTLRNGRTIYGGGGIMPDCFVPLDTTENTRYYRSIVAKGVLTQYVIDYIDKHRKDILSKHKTFEQFKTSFKTTDRMLADLRVRSDSAKIEFKDSTDTACLPLLRDVIKGIIARDLYQENAYSQIVAPHNPSYREAIDIINDPERYRKYLRSE